MAGGGISIGQSHVLFTNSMFGALWCLYVPINLVSSVLLHVKIILWCVFLCIEIKKIIAQKALVQSFNHAIISMQFSRLVGMATSVLG